MSLLIFFLFSLGAIADCKKEALDSAQKIYLVFEGPVSSDVHDLNWSAERLESSAAEFSGYLGTEYYLVYWFDPNAERLFSAYPYNTIVKMGANSEDRHCEFLGHKRLHFHSAEPYLFREQYREEDPEFVVEDPSRHF